MIFKILRHYENTHFDSDWLIISAEIFRALFGISLIPKDLWFSNSFMIFKTLFGINFIVKQRIWGRGFGLDKTTKYERNLSTFRFKIQFLIIKIVT